MRQNFIIKIYFLQNGENSPPKFLKKKQLPGEFSATWRLPQKSIQHDSYKGIFLGKKNGTKSRQILSKQFCEIAIFRH
jgi:hypothetical protein